MTDAQDEPLKGERPSFDPKRAEVALNQWAKEARGQIESARSERPAGPHPRPAARYQHSERWSCPCNQLAVVRLLGALGALILSPVVCGLVGAVIGGARAGEGIEQRAGILSGAIMGAAVGPGLWASYWVFRTWQARREIALAEERPPSL